MGLRGVQALADSAGQAGSPLLLSVLGPASEALPLSVTVSGSFLPDDLESLLRESAAHAVLLLAIWQETWSFVLTAALKQGLPVIVFNIGAPAARLRWLGRGHVLRGGCRRMPWHSTAWRLDRGAAGHPGEASRPPTIAATIRMSSGRGTSRFAHWLRFGREEGRDAAAPADPPPLDIPRLLGHRRRGVAYATVDVVMPVYGGRAMALQAIDSVLGAATRQAFELVVVDDASPDPLLCSELQALAEAGLITLMENERNVGFVGAVNRGVALHPGRDVVLLNSDVRVFGDWLDRLLAALRTATATPLSNAAKMLSYPATLCENRLPGDLDIAQWDRLCAATDCPPVEIPTGVGFCMAVRRACLDQVGAFDQERFGRGYGEENDFCLRAAAAGWLNVAATSLFVWHRGGTSFGEERDALVEAA